MVLTAQSQKFGIISDRLGVAEDFPTVKIPAAFSPESSGVYLQYGLARAMPGAAPTFLDDSGVKTQTPDGNIIIRHWRHISAAGIEYVFVYTKAHAYLWNDTTKTYTTMHTTASDCTLWDTVSMSGRVISTNNIDKVLVWLESTPATAFVPLDTASGLDLGGGQFITKAKYLNTSENYLWLLGTTEAGVGHPRRARWSSYGEVADFDTTGSGDTSFRDFLEGSDIIKGSAKYTVRGADILVIFKEKSCFLAWLVESDDVWNMTRAEGSVGLLATHSVINDKEGNVYYFGSDYTVRKLHYGKISQRIDKTIKGMSIAHQDDIEATYIDQYNQIWWSIPSSAGSTGNDKIVAYNLEYQIWHPYPFSIRAFGEWSQQESTTIDGLDTLSDTIDGLDAELDQIDLVQSLAGFPLELGSDYSGFTYNLHQSETDMGSAVTRSFVLATHLTNGISLPTFKRVHRIQTYVVSRSTEQTLTLSVKEDNATAYTNLGEISLQGEASIISDELKPNLRAEFYLFQYSGTTLFDFVAAYFSFSFDGEL